MKLVVNIKLVPTPGQYGCLKETLKRANVACNAISQTAFEQKIFGQYALQKLTYTDTKALGLSAQMAVRSIAKVADAYKKDTKTLRQFKKYSAQPYDARIIRVGKDFVSIWTLTGRQKIPFVMGKKQRHLFEFQKGEIDLMFVDGIFYLACVCDIPTPEEIEPVDVLGVDFGIVNIATDSTGKNYSGAEINKARCTFKHRRSNLQRKGTKSAKRKLKQISGKQARYQKDVNHCVSKEIVQDAKRTCSAIALENLGGIRGRVTARRHQRERLSNWGFSQLRTFITYKAKQAGIPVVLVNPKNTSRECPKCGHIDKKNRKTRDEFVCIKCGLAGSADAIAALNIRARAVVRQPMVAMKRGVVNHVSSVTSPRL
jgi:IS605 OrfB family transposase